YLGLACHQTSQRLLPVLCCFTCVVFPHSVKHAGPPSVETAPQREPSPPLAESQHSKDVSSFSSPTSSPWDSPENPFQALKPLPARAQSAPITLPAERGDPVKSPAAASPPKSGDALCSASQWSQSQWIPFSDHFPPPRRQGPGSGVKELPRLQSGAGRPLRFLSDGSADECSKAAAGGGGGAQEADNPPFSDVFSGVTDRATMATAQPSKIFNGNTRNMCYACSFEFLLCVLFNLN
ncbi:uncharacterized protein LOC143010967, partial [Genypterus blacodes]|uniref:uncharacterized protein LOC143010967 n=1 Tax=Genypterus blacodes TaxID=154954 RepID=UPI003F75777E